MLLLKRLKLLWRKIFRSCFNAVGQELSQLFETCYRLIKEKLSHKLSLMKVNIVLVDLLTKEKRKVMELVEMSIMVREMIPPKTILPEIVLQEVTMAQVMLV